MQHKRQHEIADLSPLVLLPPNQRNKKLLNGNTALVTGSTSGIGHGIALALAAEGANVILNGFGGFEPAKAGVAKLGVKVGYHGADMSKPAEIEAMITYANYQFCSVDILVNNVGIQHVAPIESFLPEKWDAIIAINMNAAFHAMRCALPRMRAKTGGTSSVSPRRTASLARRKKLPTSPPNTASSV